MAFSDSEKTRVLHFLGYPDWQSLASSIQLGYPASTQPLFLVRDSFQRLSPEGEQAVRRDLCQCEAIEAQLADARSRMRVTKIGEIEVNARESQALRGELTFWTRRLADDLGVFPNPYSQMDYLGMGGGMNAKVQG